MCAWSTPSSRTTGDIITAAIWNQDVVDNPKYLKGAAGTVTIESQVNFDNDAQFYADKSGLNPLLNMDTFDYISFNRASDYFLVNIGSGVEPFRVDANGPLNQLTGLYLLAGTGAKRHVESGTSAAEAVAQAATNDDAFTFVNAFASNPAVADGMTHTGTGPSDDARVLIKTASLSTTGVTLQKYNNVPGGLTMTTYYIAEGAD